jgi:hypothetical protein
MNCRSEFDRDTFSTCAPRTVKTGIIAFYANLKKKYINFKKYKWKELHGKLFLQLCYFDYQNFDFDIALVDEKLHFYFLYKLRK